MPRNAAPILQHLTQQISGICGSYLRMMDDEFLFAATTQIPQVITIYERTHTKPLPFGINGDHLRLPELLAMIAYRYGFTSVKLMGHGGYAIVFGYDAAVPASRLEPGIQLPIPIIDHEARRVLRLVPDHHVQDVTGNLSRRRDFDVRLDANNEPIRDSRYPLILSDVFLLPRHTTRLVFYEADGKTIMQAGGHPAILHCQLLPEVVPMNASGLNRKMTEQAGDLLEAALATLGVSVSDAHGGNGGVLIGRDGQPLLFQRQRQDGTTQTQYIPVVLDYGYYSEIGARTLAAILLRYGVGLAQVAALAGADYTPGDTLPQMAQIIKESGLLRKAFGQLLYQVNPPVISPEIWIEPSDAHWKTTKEKTYPPLQDQARLNTFYPAYDEILFPQRIEEYHFTLAD